MTGFIGRKSGVLALAALAALAWSGCGGTGGEAEGAPEDLPSAAVPMTASAQELVAQGNDAQREGRYTDALGFYQEAMAVEPGHPVPQFGALMAALALGETALADSLRESLALSSPDLLAMLDPDGGMGGGMGGDPHGGMGGMPGAPPLLDSALGALPAGHPTFDAPAPDTVGLDTSGGR
ncbi:hypothetical protein ACFL0I_01985, partial [Gemmatimonadota bacterium]